MADVSYTASNVICTTSPLQVRRVSEPRDVRQARAAVAIAAGQPVRLVGSTLYLSQATDNYATAKCGGVALNSAGVGQWVFCGNYRDVLYGVGTFVQGGVYVVSATAGGIAPIGDLLSEDTVTVVGVARTTGQLRVQVIEAEVLVP